MAGKIEDEYLSKIPTSIPAARIRYELFIPSRPCKFAKPGTIFEKFNHETNVE